MKLWLVLLSFGALAALPAAAQTTSAAPGVGLSHRTPPGQAALSHHRPQIEGYRAGFNANSSSYQTRPNSLRVVVPDTTDRQMPRLVLPTPAPGSRAIVPLPPQQRVQE